MTRWDLLLAATVLTLAVGLSVLAAWSTNLGPQTSKTTTTTMGPP